MKKKVLVLCTANSCRSQMAHGYLNYFAQNELDVSSAGIVTEGVNPVAIQVMKEDGVDISHHRPVNVVEYSHDEFDFVLTVCESALEKCPYFPARIKNLHHDFPDPTKAKGSEEHVLDQFRMTRDMIRKYVRDFVQQYVNVSS
jgi:arsenate reductase (thioredoxin)